VVELNGAVVPKHDSSAAKASPVTPAPAKPTS
jgi:hypothetical protein